jgi:hypothetical protein
MTGITICERTYMRIEELNIVPADRAREAAQAAVASAKERESMSQLMASTMNRIKSEIKAGKMSYVTEGVNPRFDADEWIAQMTSLGYVVTDLSGTGKHLSRSYQVSWE